MTGPPLKKNKAAVTLGRLGGKARARALGASRRGEIAALGAAMRWRCARCGFPKALHPEDHEWVSPKRIEVKTDDRLH
jgi:ribosomal protein L37E